MTKEKRSILKQVVQRVSYSSFQSFLRYYFVASHPALFHFIRFPHNSSWLAFRRSTNTVFEKRSSISMRLVACLSYVYNDKEGNDRLSWPRFNTSTYEEKVRARNAKSRAYFSILHFQTPCADQFVHAKVQSLLRLSELLEFEAVQFANFTSSSPSSQIVRLYSRTLRIWSSGT